MAVKPRNLLLSSSRAPKPPTRVTHSTDSRLLVSDQDKASSVHLVPCGVRLQDGRCKNEEGPVSVGYTPIKVAAGTDGAE